MKALVYTADPQLARAIEDALLLRWPDLVLTVVPRDSDPRWLERPNGSDLIPRHGCDLILIDCVHSGVLTPGALEMIRGGFDLPLIVLCDEKRDMIRWLDSGADDCMVKPVEAGELVARTAAVLRRRADNSRDCDPVLMLPGNLIVDSSKRVASVGGREIGLTPYEWQFLTTLMRNSGATVSHETLQNSIWGANAHASPKALRMIAQRLRKKLRDATGESQVLVTRRGLGYSLRTECP